jgi:hypothetical protein
MLDTAGPSLEEQRPVTQEALSRRVFVISGALLLAFGAFVYGFVAEQRHLWPYELARSSYPASRSLVLFGEIVPEGRRVHAPSDAARASFKIYDASTMGDGYYDSPHAFYALADGSIVVGFDRGDVVARLDACGKPLWVKSAIYHPSFESAQRGRRHHAVLKQL